MAPRAFATVSRIIAVAAAVFVAGCVCVQHALEKPERWAAACDAALTEGDHLCRVDVPPWEGEEPIARTFLVHVPPSQRRWARRGRPVVLAFHGLGSNSQQMAEISKLSDKSDREGFIVVYPQGRGVVPTWNTAIVGSAKRRVSDDVYFVERILVTIAGLAKIDSRRVYATGFSNGGLFAHKLACEMSGSIAAIATVAGINAEDACPARRPMPVLAFHGMSDPVVLYGGAMEVGVPGARETMADWAARNGCATSSVVFEEVGAVRCEQWPDCNARSEVILCSVRAGGHTWPGGRSPRHLGLTTTDADATDLLWKFFERHPL